VITGVAFVPSTPMLLPAVSAGASGEIEPMREAALAALRRACSSGPEQVVVLGAGSVGRASLANGFVAYDSGIGSVRGFGVPFDVPLDPAQPPGDHPHLPLSLTVGAWLLSQVGWPGERRALEIDPAADDHTLDRIAATVADDVRRTVLLVVADGSAARSEKAPASLHPDSAAFDSYVASALRAGSAADLIALDRSGAVEVSAQGRPAWRVAARACAAGASFDAALTIDEAPYGVGYFVASWLART